MRSSNSQKLAHQRLEAQASSNSSGAATPANERHKRAEQTRIGDGPPTAAQRRRLKRQHSAPATSSPLRSPNGLAPLPIITTELREDGTVVLLPDGTVDVDVEEVLLDDEGSAALLGKTDNHHAVSPIPEAVNEDDEGDAGGSAEGNEGDGKEVYLKSRLWWAGLALCAVGEAGNFLSYGFAPASVVAPLGTVGELPRGSGQPVHAKSDKPTSPSLGGELLCEPFHARGAPQVAGSSGRPIGHHRRGDCSHLGTRLKPSSE